jgi:hypothetical protein
VVELPPGCYADAKVLFSVDFPNSTMLFAVLEDHIPGHVYVDRRAAPTWNAASPATK